MKLKNDKAVTYDDLSDYINDRTVKKHFGQFTMICELWNELQELKKKLIICENNLIK